VAAHGVNAKRRRAPAGKSTGSRARARTTTRRNSRTRSPRRPIRILIGALVVALAAVVTWPLLHHAVKEISLPLRHEDIIRQQAREKNLDASLIAAVIYAESKFRDQTSAAGAKGLMQILPATAHDIARKSGGVRFSEDDLGTPQVNIAYGSYYLRYLLDRYGDNDVLAIAAYNAGETNVDKWVVNARQGDREFTLAEIPFAETRAYVQRVLAAREDYRETYARELGL
jgi:soluble lytic murein transglycosylase